MRFSFRSIKTIILLFIVSFPGISFAQDTIPEKDFIDLVSKRGTLVKGATLEVNRNYLTFLPIIGYAPANGFMIGAGCSISRLMDDAPDTRLSTALVNVQLTTEQQINFNLRTNIYTPKDKFILQGDFRFLIFSQSTYGLGITDFPGAFYLNDLGPDETSGEQPMRFNYLRLYESVYRRISGKFYAGLGIKLDHHINIRDEKLDLVEPDTFYTSHYVYSTYYGFSPEKYTASGFSFEALYDSRDNASNAYKGYYGQLSYRYNPGFMSTGGSSSSLFYDFRTYLKLTGIVSRHVIAFWTWGSILTSGRVPYLTMPAIGWDTYNRSGRGYIQGRYRGENMYYFESEYRFPITRNRFLGGVAFFNATTTSHQTLGQKSFENYAIGYGGGLRLNLQKSTRTNLGIDYGIGENGSSGVYFTLLEAF